MIFLSYSIENDSGPLLIGEDDSTDSNRYFDGSICDVRVYNRALNIDEITKLVKYLRKMKLKGYDV